MGCSCRGAAAPANHHALLPAAPLAPSPPAGRPLQDLASGEWVVDSGVVCDFLEATFPQPPLGTVEASPQM